MSENSNSEVKIHQSDLGAAEIDRPVRPIKARDLPDAEKSARRPHNYWAADEFKTNPDPAKRISNVEILNQVVEPLDMFETPTSAALSDALTKLGNMWATGVIPHTPAGEKERNRARDAINAKLKDIKGGESLFGTPEIPKTPAEWLKLVRKQLSDFEAKENYAYPPNNPWDEMLRLKSTSGLGIKSGDALEKMQDAIANKPITIESEGELKTITFKERIIAECKARQALHNRYVQWRALAGSLTSLEKGDPMANGAELDPDKIEALGTMMAQPGQAELTGNRLSRAFWAYRMIAHNLPYDGIHKLPNIFREMLPPAGKKPIHDAIVAFVGGDEDAERLAFRLAHVWREAACGDNSPGDEARGPKTGDSDATSRLSFVEKWRTIQLTRKDGTREAGPKQTLRGFFPGDLLPPLLDVATYKDTTLGATAPEKSLAEELQTIPNHLFRKIKWHANQKANFDAAYARNIGDAINLFDKITTYGVEKGDSSVPGFQKLNKLVADVISDPVVIETMAPGTGIGYWKADGNREAILEDQKKKWQKKVRKGIVVGMLRSSNIGLLGGEARVNIVSPAVNAGSISYSDSLTL